MARLIISFLEALELEDVTLVGNDSGDALSQFLIDTDPTRIGRLVLTNCDAFDKFAPPPFDQMFKLGRNAGVLRDTVTFLTGVDKQQLLDVSTRLEQFDKPVLLLWGDADRFFKLDFARRLSRVFPDARLVEIPGGRTFHPLDHPRRVATEIGSTFYCCRSG